MWRETELVASPSNLLARNQRSHVDKTVPCQDIQPATSAAILLAMAYMLTLQPRNREVLVSDLGSETRYPW